MDRLQVTIEPGAKSCWKCNNTIRDLRVRVECNGQVFMHVTPYDPDKWTCEFDYIFRVAQSRIEAAMKAEEQS